MTQMKIRGVGRLRVNIRRKGRASKTVRRLVKTNGTLSGAELAAEMETNVETIEYILGEITRIVRAGYEVRLGTNESGVRFYPLLDKEFKRMSVVAQTIGAFRESVGDLKFDVCRGGEEIDEREKESFKNAVENEFVSRSDCVTPDMMVSCPKCGYEFRVGRKLAQNTNTKE